MNLDFGVIFTQIVGFLLALWLLKKFAWKPLLGLLEERRAKIVGEFEKIDTQRAEALALKTRYDDQLKTIDAEARKRIQDALGEGQRMASQVKDEAQSQARSILARGEEELLLERNRARTALRDDIVRLALGAAEKVVKERMDDERHRKLIDEFLREVETRPTA